MRNRQYIVYILASGSRVLYVGMTSNMARRIMEHRRGTLGGFTRRYGVHRLVYFECTPNARAAAARERQLKRWPRARKIALIEAVNPLWLDVWQE